MIKKIIFLFVIFGTIAMQSQTGNVIKKRETNQITFGTLNSVQFKDFKNFLNKTSDLQFSQQSSFLINYTQPKSDCFYNQYSNNECNSSWFENNIFKKIELPIHLSKFYFQHKTIDQKDCLNKIDLNGYLYKTFFDKNELCYGLIIVNDKGDFRVLTGEYTSKDITDFLKVLNIK